MNGYLLYESKGPYVGILHCLSNIEALIMEAIYLNRIPVIRRPLIHPMHNFGVKLDTHWPKYLNLSKTEVYIRNRDNFELIQKPFSYIFEKDFKSLTFAEDQVFRTNHEHEIADAENKNYELIVRSMDPVKMGWWLFAVPAKIKQNIRLNLKVSDDVVRKSENIIKQLGWYAAIHVRRSDRLKRNKKLKNFTSVQHIFKRLRDIVPLNANVYILTDEKDRRYFDDLKEHYEIFQYFDFDELNEIVSGHKPDNSFLYLIEQCIFDNAAKKIETFKWDSYFSDSSGAYSLSKRNYFWDSAEIPSLSKYTCADYTINFRFKRYLRDRMPLIWKSLSMVKKILNIVNTSKHK